MEEADRAIANVNQNASKLPLPATGRRRHRYPGCSWQPSAFQPFHTRYGGTANQHRSGVYRHHARCGRGGRKVSPISIHAHAGAISACACGRAGTNPTLLTTTQSQPISGGAANPPRRANASSKATSPSRSRASPNRAAQKRPCLRPTTGGKGTTATAGSGGKGSG